MNRLGKRAKEKAGTRKDFFAATCILAYIGSLIFRICLYYLIGEKGVGYFGIANEIYIVFSFIFSYGLSEAVASLTRYRVRREQFKNAEKVLHGALLLAVVIGGLFSIVFLFLGQLFADKVVKLPLTGLAISLMAPALVFSLLTGAFRGYFQGNGSKIPSLHSKILETVFVMAGGLIGAGLFYNYGKKVSALLQNVDYASAYGAMGASVGFLTASVLCFLHMAFLHLLYRRKMQRQMLQDAQRSQDRRGHILRMLVGSGILYAVYGFLFHCLPLLDGCLYFHTFEANADTAVLWGNYYGKYMVIIGVIGSLIMLTSLDAVKRIIVLTEREEYRIAREKIGFLMHQMALFTVPAAIFTAVFAENLLNIMFKGNNTRTAEWIAWGSVGIVCYVFALLFMNLLMRLKKMNYVLGCGGAALLVHVLLTFILLQKTQLNVLALILGNIVFYMILMVMGFLLVARSFQYTQEWIRSVAFTVVNAGIAGLISMLCNRALTAVIGSTLSLIICLLLGVIVYMVLLIVTRTVMEREMENISGGFILRKLAILLHFM